MKKLNKFILVMVIIMGVLISSSQVQAAIVLNSTGGNTTTNAVENETTNNTVNNVVNNTVKNTINTNKVNNITNTLPKTGIEDSPAAIIMIIGVISAVYAYKKIRDYNV